MSAALMIQYFFLLTALPPHIKFSAIFTSAINCALL